MAVFVAGVSEALYQRLKSSTNSVEFKRKIMVDNFIAGLLGDWVALSSV